MKCPICNKESNIEECDEQQYFCHECQEYFEEDEEQ